MSEIESDKITNERNIIVRFKTYEVLELIKNTALKDVGISDGENITIKVQSYMTSKDSLGYDRQTEAQAEGARVTITINREHTDD